MDTQSKSENISSDVEESYPSIMERIQAVALDGGLVLIGAFLIFSGLDGLGMENSDLKAPLFILLFVLYDPLMIAFAGGTIGHKMVNLHVKQASDPSRNVNLLLAFLRFALKTVLGWISLLTITTNTERKAIHDFASDSIVLKRKKRASDFFPVPD
ncbi:MAG: RDD family protein [Bacteroidota bacterium]